MAYIYTKFAISTLHGNNPYPSALLFVDESLYNFKILETHCAACVYTGRKEEGKKYFNELLNILKTHPEYFTSEESQKINMNKQFFI